MDAMARKVLQTYDALSRDSLDLHALFEIAGGNQPAEREAVLDAVQQLVTGGLLQSSGGGDFYARTESGRMAVIRPYEVTLYTRPGCQLCDDAKVVMWPILREVGSTLREVNIDEDPVLRERYGEDIPVIFVGNREAARHHVIPSEFRKRFPHSSS